MKLTEEQVKFFRDEGYLVVENVFTTGEVAAFQHACDLISAQAAGLTASTDRLKMKVFEDSTKLVQQVGDPHEMSGVWLDLVKDVRLLDMVEALLGPNLLVYYSQLMMKAPRQGFTAPWHQDFAFFPHSSAEILACTVAIDDATLENGCVRVIPGSHKLGLINHYDQNGVFTGIVQDDHSFDARTEVALPATAGSVIFWHSLTLHASHPNRTEKPRRALVIEYKNPAHRLLTGSFSSRGEVRNIGLMVRGKDPSHDLLSPV
ncbi:MAG: phytanoyl-CoA dioxygenase family protein [Caldilinea sp. CFX5]|nr:phytanoyl-CoA dioxygenase family protein [Caldilinea sp. CFX5]